MNSAIYLARMVTRIIGHTLLRIFDSYATAPRRFMDRCGVIFLVCLLFGIACGALVTWLGAALGLVPGIYGEDFTLLLYMGMFGEHQYTFALFTELAIGLFAVRVWRDGVGVLGERSFGRVWGSITHLNWVVFGVCFLALLALKLLLFDHVFDLTGLRDEYFDGFDDSIGPRKYRFLKYLNDVFAEALSWMPVAMSVLLLHKEARMPVKGEAAGKALRGWVAIAILNFLIVSLEWAVLDYVKRFLLPIFSIPFEASLIPMVINGLLVMLLGGLLLPAHLLCIAVPFEEWAGKGRPDEPDDFDPGRRQPSSENPAGSST